MLSECTLFESLPSQRCLCAPLQPGATLSLVEVTARRSAADAPVESTWRPVDLVCEDPDGQESELVVRTKLLRDRRSAAVCVAEAVAHRILACLGLRVADAYAVSVGVEFAASLTAQHEFDPAVIPGRHWGTRLIAEALEATISHEDYDELRSPADLFTIHLVDVLCAYRDRQTHGNVLLVPAAGGKRFDVLPIDQSDCFAGPDCICTPHLLDGAKGGSHAQPFDGMEALLLERGPTMVNAARDKVLAARACILEAVTAPPDEWYDRAGTEPERVYEFLAHRLDNFDALARIDHWRMLAGLGGGGSYVLL